MTNFPTTTLPVTSFAANRQEQNPPSRPGNGQDQQTQLQNSDNDRGPPSRFVYQGQVLEQPTDQDRRYRPQFNQDIDPQNRSAINSYQQIGQQGAGFNGTDSASGRIVDFFI